MPIYNVVFEITGTAFVTVEAENEDEAESNAKDAIEDGMCDVEYEATHLYEITKQ